MSGNKYCLAAQINYKTGKLFIRHVLTHREYDEFDWKSRRTQ